MLHGHIFIAHGLCLVLAIDQYLIQVIADIQLAASAHFRKTFHCLLGLIGKHVTLNPHLGNQLQNQAVIQGQETVEQMLLVNLLVPIFICQLLTVLHCFH